MSDPPRANNCYFNRLLNINLKLLAFLNTTKETNCYFCKDIMNLKSIIANRELKAKLESVNRKKRVFNLDSASSIGILWEYDQRETFMSLEKELRNMGIETSTCVTFLANAVIPRGIIGFTRKQLSWTEIPKSEDANQLSSQKI